MYRHTTCRVCGGAFHPTPLLEIADSPESAQGFRDAPGGGAGVVDLRIQQCRYCGLVQHDLPPVSYFRDVVRAVAFSEEMSRFRKGQLSEWIMRHGLQDRRILELGCGKGEYLELLQAAGARQVFGIEHSKDNLQVAQGRGLQARNGYVAPGFENPWREPFGAFAIFSFMEHWPDLKGSLQALHGMLSDHACGLVEVPNFELVVGHGLYSEFTPDHIFYFDRDTLRAVLECNGFEVVSIDTVWHNYILSAQVRKRAPIQSDFFLSRQRKLVEQLDSFVSRFQPQEVVVWGAGHQALAVISIARLRGKVAHVVDSAPFKQNRYTPGSDLLVKAPESLLEDEPQALVIMAAAYSDEVARTVAAHYPRIEHVAILREDRLEEIRHAH